MSPPKVTPRRWGASSFDTLRDRFDFRLASRVSGGVTMVSIVSMVSMVSMVSQETFLDTPMSCLQGADGQRKRTEDMLGRLTFADWEVVKHMGECMDKDNFTDLINMMADNFDEMEIEEEKVTQAQLRLCGHLAQITARIDKTGKLFRETNLFDVSNKSSGEQRLHAALQDQAQCHRQAPKEGRQDGRLRPQF